MLHCDESTVASCWTIEMNLIVTKRRRQLQLGMPPNLLTHQIDAELLNDYEFCVTCIGRDQTVQFGDNRYIALNSTLHNRLNRLTRRVFTMGMRIPATNYSCSMESMAH